MRPLPIAAPEPSPSVIREKRMPIVVTALFAATGIAAHLVAGVLLVVWAPQLSAPGGWASPQALALTHVLAIGFVTALALGILHHITPLAFGRTLPLPWIGLLTWAGYTTGATLLIAGLATAAAGAVAAGGALLGSSLLAVLAHLGTVPLRSRRRRVLHLFQISALSALAAVAVLGALLALSLRFAIVTDIGALLGAKIIVAIGGWLALLLVSVSYQMVPMFTPTRVRPRHGRTALILLCGSSALTALAVLLGAPGPLRVVLMAFALAGVTLFALDVWKLLHGGIHAGWTPIATGQLAGALLLVVSAFTAVPGVLGVSPWPQIAVVTALLGWAPVSIAANALRLVPFIAWQAMPPGRRPRVFIPAPASIGWVAIALPGAAAVLLAWGIAGAEPAAAMAGAVLSLAGGVTLAAGVAVAVRRTSRMGALAAR